MLITKFNQFITESKVKKDERIELLRDENYIIVAPLTETASCKYGAFTNWCTAVPYSGAFYSVKDTINREAGTKLVYVIQVGYTMTDENEQQSDEYKYLFDKLQNREMSEEDHERFVDISTDVNSLNFSKIAVEYNFKSNEFNLWSANNINISDEPWYYDIDDLPIEDYAIKIIKEFCEK